MHKKKIVHSLIIHISDDDDDDKDYRFSYFFLNKTAFFYYVKQNYVKWGFMTNLQ